jgi:hypothetical protein
MNTVLEFAGRIGNLLPLANDCHDEYRVVTGWHDEYSVATGLQDNVHWL